MTQSLDVSVHPASEYLHRIDEYLLFSNCAWATVLSLSMLYWSLIDPAEVYQYHPFLIYSFCLPAKISSKACQHRLSLKVVHSCRNTKTRESVNNERVKEKLGSSFGFNLNANLC